MTDGHKHNDICFSDVYSIYMLYRTSWGMVFLESTARVQGDSIAEKKKKKNTEIRKKTEKERTVDTLKRSGNKT